MGKPIMSFRACPGSLTFTQPHPEIIACPECGTDVEIWSDEATGKCANCGRVVIRTESQSCVDWCRFAEVCLGEEKFRQYGAMKAAVRKAALLQYAADRLGTDSAVLAASQNALRFAEAICSEETASDPNLVIAAVVMRALTAPSSMPGTQDVDWRKIVGGALRELGYDDTFCGETICILEALIKPQASVGGSMEFQIAHDAFILARYEDKMSAGHALPETSSATECMTERGRVMAVEMHRRNRRSSA